MVKNVRLYTSLPILCSPCVDVSVEFIMILPLTQSHKDFIMVVVNRFSKMAHFIACAKTFVASKIVDIYFRKIVCLHGILKIITEDDDLKLFSYFWKTLWGNLRTKLYFSSARHPRIDGQMKDVNQSLENLFCFYVDKRI